MKISIPGRGEYLIKHLILDLNGTIALDGELIEGVAKRLDRLGRLLNICIITADTRGNARHLLQDLNVRWHKIEKGEESAQKLELVLKMGKDESVSMGNGLNDVSMLRESAIGICILGKEGAAKEALLASDLVITDINDALDLLIKPERLAATLRR